MKLVTFDSGRGPCAGVLRDERVHEAAPLLREPPLRDVQALLELPYDALARLRAARLADGRPLAGLRLLPPILRPPTLRDHIAFEEHASRTFTRELPDVWRRRPLYYYSNTSRLFGPGADVPMPATERLDYELEVAAVIGRAGRDLSDGEALDAIAGFTILNDWSARDVQYDEMTYGLGPSKGKDFATSLGPCLVTTDELADFLVDGRLALACTARVNGETWAESSTAAMYHSWSSMVRHASVDSVLLPGDVLGSGTVGGGSIGEAIRKGIAARYLRPGDSVELSVEGLGTLANRIVAGPGRDLPDGYLPPNPPPMPKPLA